MARYIDELIKSIDWERFWKEYAPCDNQTRYEDDSPTGQIGVLISQVDGDAWINFIPDPDEFMHNTFRFRMRAGGGQSVRMRNILCLLALAIKAENEDEPQYRPLPTLPDQQEEK